MPENDGLTWVVLEDFTPGIITNSALSYAATGGNTGPVPGNAVGQAQSAVGCIALPHGGLAPLPGLIAPITNTASNPDATTITNGFFVVGPLFNEEFYGDQLVFGWEGNTGLEWSFLLFAVDVFEGVASTTTILTSEGPQAFTVGGYMMLTGETTSANTTPANPGVATLAIGYWWHDPNPTVGFLWLYPDPTGPSSSTPLVLSPLRNDAVCHQNRIIGLIPTQTDWGASGALVYANEFFSYTDPPNGLTFGAQSEQFVQEHPFGHGTWGSISASELFLVKHNGGGYVIQGDLNSPTVTRLPGVMSTYGLMCRGGDTVIGFAYASMDRGLWVWNGSNTSQKISNQLDDNFFVNPTLATLNLPVIHGPTVDVHGWGDWIVTTNDYLFDTNTGGWWKLPPSTGGQEHLFYGVSFDGDTLYATPPKPTTSIVIDRYSRSNPTASFSWVSYPIRLPEATKEQQFSVQKIVLRAQGSGTVTVTVTGVGGSSSAALSSPSDSRTFVTTAQPSMQAIHLGLPAQDVTVSITSTGASGHPAPIVYSVAIGYVEQNPVSAS